MQAAFQKHTDNAVSKTVNFPHSATREDVDKVYQLAYELGCKGVTIYRDGSRGSQVLNIGKVSKEAKSDEEPQAEPSPAQQQNRLEPRPRPAVTMGITEKVKIGCGNLYVTVNYDENGICEVFTNTGRHGGCPSQSEATARLVSIALRSGIDVQTIIGQLKGIRCPSTIRQPGMKVTSCPDAIARAIEKVMRSQNGGQMPSAVQEMERELNQGAREEEVDHSIAGMRFCPECGAPVVHEGGCVICRQCGYSKCG